MKKLFNLLFIVIITFSISGCSNSKNISEEQAKNIVNQIKNENIENIEFNIKNKKLILTVKDEFINKQDIEKIIKKFQINDKNGFEAFKKENFNENIFEVEIKNEQNNSIIFSTDNVENYDTKILTKKYTQKNVEENIIKIKKHILLFNDLVGRLEIELKKNNDIKDLSENYKKNYEEINIIINNYYNFSKDNSDYIKLEATKQQIKKAEELIKLTNDNVNSAINNKNYIQISNIFLNINSLDKIARELI